MNIVEILHLRGLDISKKVKLIRHQDKRYDVWELYRDGKLDIYQSYQSNLIFECDFIVAFIGLENSQARFIGVYKVNGHKQAKETSLPSDFPHPGFFSETDVFYNLVSVPGFEDLKDRVVIDWGKSALAWHQWLTEKEIIEILPKGYIKDFPGYLDFILKYDDLVTIIEHPEANREWYRMLKAIAGIYLIVDNYTGNQYVGSAYGESGIWGRWSAYAKTGHGGNQKLKELLENTKTYAKNFHFSILHTLPKTLTLQEVIEYESLYKKKLGTRSFGLNLN